VDDGLNVPALFAEPPTEIILIHARLDLKSVEVRAGFGHIAEPINRDDIRAVTCI
jgi:hypothetical protein